MKGETAALGAENGEGKSLAAPFSGNNGAVLMRPNSLLLGWGEIAQSADYPFECDALERKPHTFGHDGCQIVFTRGTALLRDVEVSEGGY